MSDRKKIDRLFQEKFKDFEANPADHLWLDIEAKLDDKKRKRAIPFWWKLSGVAALLLIGLLIGKMAFNNDIAPTEPVVIEENSTHNGTSIAPVSEKEGPDNPRTNSKNDGVSGKKESNGIAPKLNHAVDAVADKSTTNENKPGTNGQKSINKNALSPMAHDTKSTIVQGPSKNAVKNESDLKVKKASLNQAVTEKSENPLATHQKDNVKVASDHAIVETPTAKNKSENNNSSVIDKNISLDGLKGENNSKIATKEVENKINDTTKNNSVVKNALEELLNEKDSKTKQESKRNRWQLTSNVAPVFLGSTSNGSPIDSTLANNAKSYNTGVGFGLGVSYAVSKKLTVRTGLNKFNMSYNTNDIVYFAGIQSRTLRNVNTSAAGARIQIESNSVVTPSSLSSSETALLPFENSFVHKNKGYLNQEMGYLEMPVEMTYALLDKKFGIKLIGGFSTLFLQDNSISVVSDNRSTFLGEASNLNEVHFSTNFGIGLKYGFLKSFEINVEPTFKYQLNTFSSDAGNFKPYVFGIYSGVSYKF